MYREFELIDRIAERFDRPEGVPLGIGDDCAVLDPNRFDLVTTDTLVEGIHFRREWSTPQQIGWKALAVSLSDVAAMGGGPGAFFLNLTLGPEDDEEFVDGLLEGIEQAVDELVPRDFVVAPAGGDTGATEGPTVITVTLLGEAPGAGPVMRGGAVRRDRIVMIGPLGLARAGVELLEGRHELDPLQFPALIEAHRRPRPLVRHGALLGMHAIPSALIDTSDGFARDLGHILERSHAGAVVDVDELPVHPELSVFCRKSGRDPLDYILTGGEDFQLCLAVPPARMPRLWQLADQEEWTVFEVGEVRAAERGIRFVHSDGEEVELDSPGYEHFAET